MTAYRPQHLSVSAVQLYTTCPAQFHRRYVIGHVIPTNPPMSFGKVFHTALEAEHRGQNAERALIVAWNVAQADLDAAGAGEMPSKAHALALLDAYKARGYGGTMGQPEKRFRLPLPSANVPVPILGYIDLPLPERRRFREFKTTSTSSWTPTKVALEHQLHVYGWAYQRIYHHRVDCAEYMIFSTVNPTVELIEGVPSPDGLRLFERAAEDTWQGIVNDRYPPCGTCKDLCKPPADKSASGPSFTWDD